MGCIVEGALDVGFWVRSSVGIGVAEEEPEEGTGVGGEFEEGSDVGGGVVLDNVLTSTMSMMKESVAPKMSPSGVSRSTLFNSERNSPSDGPGSSPGCFPKGHMQISEESKLA